MDEAHESTGSHRVPAVGPHTAEIYAATEIPRFKHRASKSAPRYAWLLSILWLVTFIGAALRLIQGVHASHVDWHDVGDGVILLAAFALTCCLWSAWEREERHPEALPKREFERRYPPSSGSDPMPEREYHRRIPYDTQTTMTGGQKYAAPFDDPEYRAKWMNDMREAARKQGPPALPPPASGAQPLRRTEYP